MSAVTRMVLGTALIAILCTHLVLGFDSSEDHGSISEYEQSPETYNSVYHDNTQNLSKRTINTKTSFLINFRNWLNQLLLQRETRGGKRCGKRRCYGLCCGGYRCCKKGWNCRYMNNIRTYTCIP